LIDRYKEDTHVLMKHRLHIKVIGLIMSREPIMLSLSNYTTNVMVNAG